MNPDMTFDGQVLTWLGHGHFKATSGADRFQWPEEQCRPMAGPLPQGFYQISLLDEGVAHTVGSHACGLVAGSGIQKIPRGPVGNPCERPWMRWGANRVRLMAADPMTAHACSTHRDNFYIHDSAKGYSHGCIEVEGTFFPMLRTYAHSAAKDHLVLQVKYVPGRKTNGGTKK